MKMVPSSYSQIYSPPKPSETFHKFPELPAELRLEIWEHARRDCHRLIKVHAFSWEANHYLFAQPEQLQARKIASQRTFENLFGEPPREEWIQAGYSLVVDGPGAPTLASVNRESRQAALKLYRVHVPCLFRATHKALEPGTFMFSPELDFLYIPSCPSLSFDNFFFPTFYLDLIVRDPRGVGVSNLAFDESVLNLHRQAKVMPQDAQGRDKAKALRQVFSKLKCFYLVETQCMRIGNSPFAENDDPCVRVHSYPVSPDASPGPGQFNRYRIDPRDIKSDLETIWIDKYRGHRILTWQQELSNWFLSPDPASREDTELKLLLTVTPLSSDSGPICSLKSAQDWMDKASAVWFHEGSDQASDGEVEFDDSLPWSFASMPTRARSRQFAFGFWLFPASSLPERPSSTRVYNMSQNWPELGLFTWRD